MRSIRENILLSDDLLKILEYKRIIEHNEHRSEFLGCFVGGWALLEGFIMIGKKL
jgi:hypothetical protein